MLKGSVREKERSVQTRSNLIESIFHMYSLVLYKYEAYTLTLFFLTTFQLITFALEKMPSLVPASLDYNFSWSIDVLVYVKVTLAQPEGWWANRSMNK